jgi:uncharacterized membrane protein YqjE
MQPTDDRDRTQTPPADAMPPLTPPSRLLDELGQLGSAVKRLFGAQLHLLAAELGLARSAVSWMLAAGLAATVAGVGFGLTLLGLVGLLLAEWFGSWPWALVALAGLQLLFLFGAIWLFRRCMHWMSLPATRDGWGAMMRRTVQRAEQQVALDELRDEGKPSK